MLHLLVTIVCVIAIIAVIVWFIGKVNIGPPLIYVIYAGIAILCILAILWLMDNSAVLHLSRLAVPGRILA